MRILQVNKFFYEKGGTERYLFSLSAALAQRGHEVIHFSMQHPHNLPSPDAEFFVRERNYDDGSMNPREGLDFIRSGEAAQRMAQLIEARRPDVAHLHNIYHQITPSIIPVLDRAGVPIVMTLHDYKLICPNYSLFDGKQYCYRCRGGRFHNAPITRCSGGSRMRSGLLAAEAYWQRMTGVYDSVRAFLAPSRFMRDQFVEAGYGDGRVLYLPAFIEESNFVGATGIGNVPDRYVLYFGRLSPEKGLHTLLDAVQGIPDVPLVIAGDGPLGPELKARCEREGLDHIRFTGYLDADTLGPLVAGAAMVVLPTESPENAPFTVLESMAAGVPVVVSDMGGLPELAEISGGKVFAHGDAGALRERMLEFWRDTRLAGQAGEQSRRAIRERFSLDAHLTQLESVYGRVGSMQPGEGLTH